MAAPEERKRKKRRRQAQGDEEGFVSGLARTSEGHQTVEPLRYKHLSVGMKLWGSVVEINKQRLKIGLPDGLYGTVDACQASDVLALLMDPNNDDVANLQHSGGRAPFLSELFFLGQYVRCTVHSLSQTGTKWHVGLSLHVASINDAIVASDVNKGMLLVACVKTVEDHGYSLTFGVKGLTGFLRKDEYEGCCGVGSTLLPGTLLECVVEKKGGRGPVQVTTAPQRIRVASLKPGPGLQFGAVLPGTLVKATIDKTLDQGLVLSYLASFTGTVDLFHMRHGYQPGSLQAYSVGQVVSARVIHVDPATHDVGLSLLDHLLHMSLPWMPSIVGGIFENATVRRVDPSMGVLLSIPTEPTPTPAYVVKAMATDDDSFKQLLESGGLKVGKQVKAKVSGFRVMDGVGAACLKPSVLEHGVMSYEDVYPGLVIGGKVERILEKTGGLLVRLAPEVIGFASELHCEGRTPTRLKKMFPPGEKVLCRVLNSSPDDKTVKLTLIKGLVKCKFPMFGNWADVQAGMRATGYVSSVKQNGVHVSFCGNVHGLVPVAGLDLGDGETPEGCFKVGQVLRPWVKQWDSRRQRMQLTLKKSSNEKVKNGGNKHMQVHGVSLDPCKGGTLCPGDKVKGKVKQPVKTATGTGFIVGITSAKGVEGQAFLESAHLSDHPLAVEALSSSLQPGCAIGTLLVLVAEPQALVTRKASLLEECTTLFQSCGDVEEGMTLPGYIAHVFPDALTIRFLGGLEGRVDRSQWPSSDLTEGDFFVGQSVRVQIMKVDFNDNKLFLTMRPTRVSREETGYLKNGFSDLEFAEKIRAKSDPEAAVDWYKHFAIGQRVQATVSEIKPYGIVCDFEEHEDLVGLIPKNHSSEGVLNEGDEVEAMVLDVSKHAGIVRLTLRPHLVSSGGLNSTRRERPAVAAAVTAGECVEAVVELVEDHYLIVSLPSKGNAVAFTSLRDINLQGLNVQQCFQSDQVIQAAVAAPASKAWGGRILLQIPLGVYLSQMSQKSKQDSNQVHTFSEGEHVQGKVTDVYDTHLLMKLTTRVHGKLSALESGHCLEDVSNFKERFHVGENLLARIIKMELNKNLVHLTLREASNELPSIGDLVIGVVSATGPHKVNVTLRRGVHGRVAYTDVHDHFLDNIEEIIHKGTLVCALVVGQDGHRSCQLSLRPSDGGCVAGAAALPETGEQCPTSLDAGDLKVGQVVTGYVKNSTDIGLWVTLSRSLDAKVLLSQMSDAHDYSLGLKVSGRVTSIAHGKISMSLKDNTAVKDVAAVQIKEGEIVEGRVQRIVEYGVFVNIDGAQKQSGLAHRSNLADHAVKDISGLFKVGQQVRTLVMKVDKETGKIALGLKPSQVGSQAEDREEADSDGDFERALVQEDNSTDSMSLDSRCSVEDLDDVTIHSGDEQDADVATYDEEDASVSDDQQPNGKEPEPASVPEDTWGRLVLDEDRGAEPMSDGQADQSRKHLSKAQKKKLKRERENQIYKQELARVSGEHTPSSATDFERLLLSTPNSSLVWVRYMTFLLSVGEVDKARGVAERALQTIDSSEETEKFNIWVAYLNLENYYGTPHDEVVMKLFQRALQYNEPKKLYLAVFNMLDQNPASQELAGQVLKTMTRKFGSSAKVWLRGIEHKLKRGEGRQSRKLLEASLKTLPKRKHVKVISHTGLLEFKCGSAEHARDIFEGVVCNYPKRIDLWSVYLDQEIKLGDQERIRSLFERATHLKLPPRKMKVLFKRYLHYEKTYGDEATVENVKKRAVEYVQSVEGCVM
ncbi:unnamed protein product [Ostreobium quekettii]|uniref:S1 motif domain-containing protein n=1 Tax=Ostreobium quekettii TaxID=121088 RepID=A0A8S1J5E7_9CHLO|nr:unnamed protein product [Ostreobium quekettii]|eukprot:evm.model.scf_1941EXC.1 EVM.evm.TU.scf_1941EXC.1   scf_1941EXC:17737-28842(+)